MLSCVEEKQLKRRIDTENSNLQVSQKQVGFKM
jgi:hypothetical protein